MGDQNVSVQLFEGKRQTLHLIGVQPQDHNTKDVVIKVLPEETQSIEGSVSKDDGTQLVKIMLLNNGNGLKGQCTIRAMDLRNMDKFERLDFELTHMVIESRSDTSDASGFRIGKDGQGIGHDITRETKPIRNPMDRHERQRRTPEHSEMLRGIREDRADERRREIIIARREKSVDE